MARAIISSRVVFSLNCMCEFDVPIPVWILGRAAFLSAAAATSISFLTALVRPHTVAFFTILLISETDKKSIENELSSFRNELLKINDEIVDSSDEQGVRGSSDV